MSQSFGLHLTSSFAASISNSCRRRLRNPRLITGDIRITRDTNALNGVTAYTNVVDGNGQTIKLTLSRMAAHESKFITKTAPTRKSAAQPLILSATHTALSPTSD